MATNFTNDDLEAIEEAITKGVLRVEFSDRTVQYRSISELKQARDIIQDALDAEDDKSRVSYAEYSRE